MLSLPVTRLTQFDANGFALSQNACALAYTNKVDSVHVTRSRFVLTFFSRSPEAASSSVSAAWYQMHSCMPSRTSSSSTLPSSLKCDLRGCLSISTLTFLLSL